MTDLERLFRQLVLNLRATDPARLRRPLELADIRDGILPYRANRRALQLETSEDYEVALMRNNMIAGNGAKHCNSFLHKKLGWFIQLDTQHHKHRRCRQERVSRSAYPISH